LEKITAGQKSLQAAGCLLCVILSWRYSLILDGSEFSGGTVTGRILSVHNIAAYLFVLALVLTFIYPRIAAGIVIAASLFALPLYLYFVAPGAFHRVVRGQYSVPGQASFVWDKWAIAAILALAVALYASLRGLVAATILTVNQPS
jgi:hypothetical protein